MGLGSVAELVRGVTTRRFCPQDDLTATAIAMGSVSLRR